MVILCHSFYQPEWWLEYWRVGISLQHRRHQPNRCDHSNSFIISVPIKGKKGSLKADIAHLRATGCRLPYGITQCYLPPDTSEHALPNPSHAGWYTIYLSRRDGRLSWPSWLDSAPAGSRTSDLSITSPTLNHCFTIFRLLRFVSCNLHTRTHETAKLFHTASWLHTKWCYISKH